MTTPVLAFKDTLGRTALQVRGEFGYNSWPRWTFCGKKCKRSKTKVFCSTCVTWNLSV